MSGGHFDYIEFRIEEASRGIDELIETNDNDSINEWGGRRGGGYSEETIEKFKTAAEFLKVASIMLRRVDYLVCGDDGENSFHRRWDNELKNYKYYLLKNENDDNKL
jgi:hypothetical protein